MSKVVNGNPALTASQRFTNFLAYRRHESSRTSIGHLDIGNNIVTPLTFASGTPLSNLYEVIEAGQDNLAASDERLELSQLKLLPPISGRDVLAVGKNYAEHAKEFNSSGYDSSDKTDQPTHPVVFTKRATSIVAHGDEIFPHQGFTESVDYEGEIGVIIGKPGFKVSEGNAMDHVWGYTIINDVTARERQRDHKQFYIGKSADTFCPMGPIAVPKEHLPNILEITTFVNGEQRQNATTEDLIFSVPFLVMTMSEGQTLQLGDVLATGTPAGVGFGFRPMKFLKPGDEIRVTVSGLGSLVNRVGRYEQPNPILDTVKARSHIPVANDKALGRAGLVQVGSKQLFHQKRGSSQATSQPILFVHGLGGTSEFFTPLVSRFGDSKAMHLVDLEGHGLSPTSALSKLSIESFASDLSVLCRQLGLTSGIDVVAHSMGCHVATQLALSNPGLVTNLVLLGPPPSPLSEAGTKATLERACLVREKGMIGVVDAVVEAGTSSHTQANNLLAVTATRQSLLTQDPEGYAKACTALALASAVKYHDLESRTLIITGAEDKVSPPALCEKYKSDIAGSALEIIKEVGHWHLFEQETAVSDLVQKFLA